MTHAQAAPSSARHQDRGWRGAGAWSWRCGLAACLLVALPAGAAEQLALSAAEQAAFGIELAAPQAAQAGLSRRFPGEVRVPNRQLQVVATPQAGVVTLLRVAEGDRVTAGELLAELRSPQLLEAQSQYLEAVTRLELAEGELARDRALHQEGIIAERRLRETESQQRELATLVDQRRQLLALAGLDEAAITRLRDSRQLSSLLPLRAPFSGVVLQQMVSVGQSLDLAAPLYQVAQLAPLWLEIHVPMDQLAGIQEGAEVLLPRLDLRGSVITVGRQAHAQDQGVLVRALIQEGAEQLRPGQFVEVQLQAMLAADGDAAAHGEDGAFWRLPASALMRQETALYVFVARDSGFAVVPVTLVTDEEQTAVVRGALRAEDQVAISGVVALKAAWLGSD